MLVGKLTIEQKESIEGQYFTEDQQFYPEQSKDGIWFLGRIQMYSCKNPDFMWVHNLELIEVDI
jgi:hypothetical protein